ncbi:MAG: DUF4430 domain-containing protein [Thermoplasmatota archaeon]
MKRSHVIALATVSLLLLTGCAEPEAPQDQSTSESTQSSNPPTANGFTWNASWPQEVDAAEATLRVQVSAPVLVSVQQQDVVLFSAEGQGFSIPLSLAYGANAFQLRLDDGTTTESDEVLIHRLAHGTLSVSYGGYPGQADHTDDLLFDMSYQSAPAYEGQDVAHPGYTTVHDFMVAWEAETGHVVEYAYSNSLGYSVSTINGIGSPLSAAPPYWLYTVNGESPDLGISGQAFQPGDVIAWCLGTC